MNKTREQLIREIKEKIEEAKTAGKGDEARRLLEEHYKIWTTKK